ncbi:class I SAM-dependent methyltransferase [Catenulispora subtropica]|uniref:class I SAM-dependent methyltransferase n=1 Tax=Catenulispora subtropica TaxID=450798 RepID=UPI0031DC01AC
MDPASAAAPPGGDHHASPVAARFDLWAPDYDSSVLQEAFYTRLHHHTLLLASHANPAPARVLDLGCGTGRLLRAAAARFPRADLIGVDISAGMLHRAARTTVAGPGRPVYLQADAAHLPVADAAVDLTICTASSHHWPDPEPPLAQLRRVTADDGYLILAHLPGIADWDLNAAGSGRTNPRTGTSRLTALLGAAGFRITKAALYAECPVMPTTVVLCARPDTAPRPRGVIRLLRSGAIGDGQRGRT